MLVTAVVQVFAREVGLGIYWGDELVRMAVLWVTMVGAIVAVGDNKHIRIDIVDRWLPQLAKKVLHGLVYLTTAAVCVAFGYYSIELIQWDYIDSTPGVGAAPAWIFETIIPISAVLMAIRFTIQAVQVAKS